MNIRAFTKKGSVLAATLVAVFLWSTAPGTGANASSAPDEWDDVFDTARAVLAKLPDPARIEATVKDSGLREAVLRAYRDLKACAKVHRDQSRATKQGTLAEFERSFKSVQTEVEQSDYKSCASKCRTDGESCEKDCAAARKKLCGCKLKEFGSFVTQCVFS